jgi:hypothetical protein
VPVTSGIPLFANSNAYVIWRLAEIEQLKITSRTHWHCDQEGSFDHLAHAVFLATNEARRLSDLLMRYGCRFAPAVRKADGHYSYLEQYRHRVIAVAEDCRWELAPIWDRLSRMLEPIQDIGRVMSDRDPLFEHVAVWRLT